MATATTKQYKLSAEEKVKMSNRINYFRTMPAQVLKTAANLEKPLTAKKENFVDHEIKSVLVGGRIMVLNVNN
jgi:hypothetical protein